MFAWRRRWTDGLSIGFTDRTGGVTSGTMGSLNLGRTDVDNTAQVGENFRRFGVAAQTAKFVAVHQVHGTDVLRATPRMIQDWTAESHLGTEAGQSPLPIADAIVTTRDACGTDAAIGVRVADCLPVVLADGQHQVVAVAHAGRVGLLLGVLARTVQEMHDAGADDLSAWIGPHLCAACYEVPADMAEEAWEQLPATRARTSWGTPAIDLARGAVAQLAELGVAAHAVGACTMESLDLHSHRRDGAQSGRQVGAVWFSDPD